MADIRKNKQSEDADESAADGESSRKLPDIAEFAENPASEMLKEFVSQKFGTVRVVLEGNDPWFVASDITVALGYANSRQAVKSNVEVCDKGVHTIDTLGGPQKMVVINESGLYSLILSSKLPAAKDFRHWVTSEILPAVKMYGAYMTPEFIGKAVSDPNFFYRIANVLKEEQEKNRKLTGENERLAVVNKALSRETETWDTRSIITRLVRMLAGKRYGGQIQLAYGAFYKELSYKAHIRLKTRVDRDPSKASKGSLLSRLDDDELPTAVQILVNMCDKAGVDVVAAIGEVNNAKVRSKVVA